MENIYYQSFDGKELEIHMYYPDDWKADDERGLVIFFFGGGWTGGSVQQFEPQAKELARLGIVTALPQYRVLSRDGSSIEVAVQDAIHCVSHMYENAEQYGVDKKKIVLSGGSAGAHLAVSSVLLKHFIPKEFRYAEDIKGLMLCNPVLDTVEFGHRAQAIQQSEYDSEQFSPLHHLGNRLPDTIIFQGIEDTTVPVETARAFGEQAVKMGYRCEVVEFADEKHGFFNLRKDQIKEYYDVLGYMVQFLYDHEMIAI